MNQAAASLPRPTRPGASLTVLDVTKWYGETSGGVRTYLAEKAAYVQRHSDLRHVLVIPGSSDEITDAGGSRTYRLRGPRIPTQQQYRFLLATRSLRRIIEHERPDVIEVGSQLFVPWVTRLATRGWRIPLVGFYHSNLERGIEAAFQLEPPVDGFSRAVTRNYLRTVDALFAARFAASDSLAGELRAAGIRNVTRVRLGVDTETFHPAKRAERARVRARLGIPDDEPFILYCGRIAVEKDIEWLVSQWTSLSLWARAWLVLVGEGPLKTGLRTRHPMNRIRWLPFERDRARLATLLACADAVVAPGPYETFGLSVLESMACGTPVISVDRGASAELVRRSGGGVTYRRHDAYDFTATVGAFLNAGRAAFGARGRRYAEREHQWDCAFDDLFLTYAGIADQARQRLKARVVRPATPDLALTS